MRILEKEAKKAFFDELYQLDDMSDGVEETSTIPLILAQSKVTVPPLNVDSRIGKLRATDDLHFNPQLDRTFSNPLAQVSDSFSGMRASGDTPALTSPDITKPSTSAVSKEQILGVNSKQTNFNVVGKGRRQAGKRKRRQSLDIKPESQQIFKGLSFFFLPNNDIAPPRAFRIRKAMEWGALWVKEWKHGITHVHVDKYLSYRDVLLFLKMESIPCEVIVVNETYIPDCIQYRFLVNPKQPYYQLKGFETGLTDQKTPTTAVSSNPSLKIKPDKSDLAQMQQTPAQTEETAPASSLQSHEGHKPYLETEKVPESAASSMENPRDALDEAIEDAKAFKNLPIDMDEGDSFEHNVLFGDSEIDQGENPTRQKAGLERTSVNRWQQGFSCMIKNDGTGKVENPNARTIEVLQQMADYYDQAKDHWRTTAYRKAIGALKKQDRRITNFDEASAIPFVGARIAAKIEEIVWTNRLRRLENTKLEPDGDVIQNFLKIYGVGLAQARKWIDQGHMSVDDLLKKVQLTKGQQIGIEHLDDFQDRIPRREVQNHDEYVRAATVKIDASVQFTIGGSYRRGAADSGDVDLIVTKPECTIETLRIIMLERIIPHLFKIGYLKACLATSSKKDGSKWHGAACLPDSKIWRRIDFLFVPWEELGAALIYFTGNDIFNRSIRLLASKKGMRLNQHGLWKDVTRGMNRKRITQGSLVESGDEKKIFELLGVPWRPPEHRIC